MDWKTILNNLQQSISYQSLPEEFRIRIESVLPGCNQDQLDQVDKIMAMERENISIYMDQSRQFQAVLKKNILLLDEVIDDQQMMDNFVEKNGTSI
jgi:hypothetical protein